LTCFQIARFIAAERSIPVTRARQEMDMIWHYHRSDDMPVKCSYCLAKGGKRVVIVQHVSASFDAEGDKINDALIEPK